MLVTPRLTVAEVLRSDPTMAQALGISESQAPGQSPKVAPVSRGENQFSRGTPRQRDEIAAKLNVPYPEPRQAPVAAPSAEAVPQGESLRRAPRPEQRDLSDADRYRQQQAAMAVSIYESTQMVDRRRPAGATGVDGYA